MRRFALLLVAVVALLVAACGTPAPAGRLGPSIGPGRLRLTALSPRTASAPTVGEVLTTTNGTWTGSPTSFAYQWQHCAASACTNITGATSSTYTIQSSDVGDTIDVIVTASNAGGSASQTSAPTGVVQAASSGFTPLHVSGNQLQNASGQTTRLIGTEISGSTYACEQNGGYGFSDTPTGSALYAPMGAWHINSFMLSLNQDCWLGINGVPAKYSGQNYINFVKVQVAAMEADHIYPVLTAQVGEPGTDQPNWYSTGNGNAPMPDANHYPLWWEEIASEFKSDPNVIFRLYEEPWPDFYGSVSQAWACWSKGDVQYGTTGDSTLPAGWESSPGAQTPPASTGSLTGCGGAGYPEQSDGSGHTYQAVGMQSLVNIIRGTGAQNIIQVPGIAFANALTCTNTGNPNTCGFLAPGTKVTDPEQPAQLMADTDNYPDSGQFMNSLATVQDAYGPVEQAMPVDMGEAGVEGNPNSFPLIQAFVSQFDTWGQSYYLSQWETWANLISNYTSGAPTGSGTWGAWAFAHVG